MHFFKTPMAQIEFPIMVAYPFTNNGYWGLHPAPLPEEPLQIIVKPIIQMG